MLVRVVDWVGAGKVNLPKELTPAKWSEHKTAPFNWHGDVLIPTVDHNSVTFCYFYHERDSTSHTPGFNYEQQDDYQTEPLFKKQVSDASEYFKDMDFQFITFNVAEEEKFGKLMAGLGFEKMGDSVGRNGGESRIHLYIKVKK